MIVLTGASGGLGQKLIPLLHEKDEIVALYNSSLPSGVPLSNVTYVRVDLGRADSIVAFVKEWQTRLRRTTVIHLAALSRNELAAKYLESTWDQVMSVNLKGNFLLTKALLPQMIGERWGRIIHVSSVVGAQGQVGTLAYSTSKTALFGMSRVIAKEYARFSVTSNVLVLGYFEAGLIDSLSDEARIEIIGQIPSRRLGKVSNIANAVDFIVSSEYLNGAVINLDGGL